MIDENVDKTALSAAYQIDRTSFEPAYMQLVDILKQQISSGRLRAGDRLPSESQICRWYQVSPMTVRRAINILVDQGIVDTVQGRGTFVKSLKLSAATFHLKELQDIFIDKLTRVSILEARIISADKRAAYKLDLLEGDRIIFVRRLLLLEEEPLIYHQECMIYDPERALVESELEVTSLQGLFQGDKTSDFKFGELSIEVTVLNEEEASVLKVLKGSAAFNLEHIFYDYADKPVSWGRFICRGDRLRFSSTLGMRGKEV